MANAEETHRKMRISSPYGEGMGRFARFLVTFVILVVIIMTTVFFAVRTEGGRDFIKDQMERRLGIKLSIGSTKIGWPYVLVIEKLISVNSGLGEEPAIEIQDMRIGLGLRTRWCISIHRSVLNLVRNSDGSPAGNALRSNAGRWHPEVFSRLGDLPLKNVAQISCLTSDFRKNTALHIDESSIRWLDSEGKVMASASGISFDVAPVKVPDRKMYHYRLRIYNVFGADSTRVHDIEREWLATDTRDYVEIYRSARQAPASDKGFWEERGEND